LTAVSTPDEAGYRQDPPQTGDERAVLQGFLDFHRGTLLWKTAGLTGEQLAQATVEPSAMSLLGLIRHLTQVEKYWFELSLAGRPVELELWTDEHPDGDFTLVDAARAEQDLANLKTAIQLSDEIARDHSLDHTFKRPGRDGEYSVRYLYIHMVEEYSRHNGHADLLRERTDGMTGE
jgi:hypothetical protein